jgi:hypothetical protein
MIQKRARQQIDVIDAYTIAVAIGADEADFKILGRRFSDGSFSRRRLRVRGHHCLDAKLTIADANGTLPIRVARLEKIRITKRFAQSV